MIEIGRVRALLSKEFLDLARNRTALVPVVVVTVLSLVLPFGVAIAVPALTGHPLDEDADLVRVSRVAGMSPDLSDNARIQLFLFQQFLMLFLVTPVTGAMALASHAVVGEKQARTLEPLLATPLTTFELLIAKVLGALLPTLAISAIGLAIYLGGIARLAAPGVGVAMASLRTLVLTILVAPAAALVALQAAILISSRVNDPRTAQQFGVLIIVPLVALMVVQFLGSLWLSAAALALIGGGLLGVWGLLSAFSVALFDRETILTRWR
ncbi:MAG TPA: ABC transporter permease subunit [Vicinamibacterales bacterium]|nr:ABC transporter permease subunit [Vicinamibacterales bacterium]